MNGRYAPLFLPVRYAHYGGIRELRSRYPSDMRGYAPNPSTSTGATPQTPGTSFCCISRFARGGDSPRNPVEKEGFASLTLSLLAPLRGGGCCPLSVVLASLGVQPFGLFAHVLLPLGYYGPHSSALHSSRE